MPQDSHKPDDPRAADAAARDRETPLERPDPEGGSPETPAARRPAAWGKLMQALPYVIGGVALIVYFVWLILQMSLHSDGGDSVPAAIFGAALLGGAAGAAAVLASRSGHR